LKRSKGKPEAAPSGFQRRAPQTIGSSTKLIIFIMASGCLQGRRPLFLLLVEVCCHWCGASFCICQRCWRGQAYCSEACRRLGRGRFHREAQRRYRQTPKGKKAHRQGENRRRHGWSQQNERKMEDLSSRGVPLRVIGFLVYAHFLMVYARAWLDRSRRCHFCGCMGRIVERFPRRQ
jgi:hypothetical protein